MTNKSGQSLIEILIGVGIAAIIGASIVGAISTIMRVGLESKNNQIASGLLKRIIDETRSVAESDWLKIYNLSPKGADSSFYPTASGTTLIILPGATTTIIGGREFTYWFSVENVNRTKCGLGEISSLATTTCLTTEGANENEIYEDPSTQKITAHVGWQNGTHSLTATQYLSRKRNLTFLQTDWSGGYNQEYFPTSSIGTLVNNSFSTSTYIAYGSSTGQIFLSNFTVSSGTLISSVYDTFSTSTFNMIMWQGVKPAGTDVKFQVAVSDTASGPWNYYGPDGSVNSYYTPSDQNTPIDLNPRYVKNKRYIRYKVFILPDASHATSSTIYDIIINWSP